VSHQVLPPDLANDVTSRSGSAAKPEPSSSSHIHIVPIFTVDEIGGFVFFANDPESWDRGPKRWQTGRSARARPRRSRTRAASPCLVAT